MDSSAATRNLVMSSSMALVAATPWAPLALALFAVAQPGVDPALADNPMLRWILGIAGGVWAGWSVRMLGLARGWPATRALQAGLVAWCVLDSAARGDAPAGEAGGLGVSGRAAAVR